MNIKVKWIFNHSHFKVLIIIVLIIIIYVGIVYFCILELQKISKYSFIRNYSSYTTQHQLQNMLKKKKNQYTNTSIIDKIIVEISCL